MLFAHPEVLEEKPGEDLVGVGKEVDRILSKLKKMTSKGSNSIIAYLGPYGAGKSTVLHNLSLQKTGYRWETFELWRYSNRDKIWDGFVIQMTASLRNADPVRVADSIEGERWNIWELSIKKYKLLWLLGVVAAFTAISFLAWLSLEGASFWQSFLIASLEYALPVSLAFAAFFGLGVAMPVPKRPLRRVFELENELGKVLKDLEEPLVIVIEDVDRTGDEGLVFLETLRNFLKANSFKKPVIVIAPQDAASFDVVGNPSVVRRSLKIYDAELYAQLPDMRMHDLENFFIKAGLDEVKHKHLRTVCEDLARAYREQMNMRLVKRILRAVNDFVTDNPGTNPAVAFVLLAMRYIVIDKTNNRGQAAALSFLPLHHSESHNILNFYRALCRVVESTEPIDRFKLQFSENEKDISLAVDEFGINKSRKEATFSLNPIYEILV